MVSKNKKGRKENLDYEPISKKINKELEELEDYNKNNINNDAPPDDLTTVLVKFLKKFNVVTGLIIFILYILINTDCFQLHIIRELYKPAYDSNTDSITDSGIIFNGVILSVFYMIFDVSYNK